VGLKAPGVGEVLCRGAEIEIEQRGETDFDQQREEFEIIQQRLESPPPAQMRLPHENATISATFGAYRKSMKRRSSPENKISPPQASSTGNHFAEKTASSSQPAKGITTLGTKPKEQDQGDKSDATAMEKGWVLEPGNVSFSGIPVRVTGNCYRILKFLADKKVPVLRQSLKSAVWNDVEISDNCISSTLTKLRNILRADFHLTANKDPIPSDDRGNLMTLRLDCDLLRHATQQVKTSPN
jgi:hypothetical protein